MLQMIPSLSKKRSQVFVQHSTMHCASFQRLYCALNDESVSKKQRVIMFQNGFGGGSSDSGGGGVVVQGGNNGSERKQTVLSAAIFNLMTSKVPDAHIGQIIAR